MANTLTEVIPQLLAQGLMALREQAVMPLLVNRQYEALAGQKGSTVDVPIPSAIAVNDVTPNNVPPSTQNIAPTSVAIQLNRWKEAPFYMTDKDLLEAQNGTIPMQASEAIKGLANEVDTFLLGLGAKFFGYSGTAGVTPFASDISDATDQRTILNKQLAPMGDRRFVMDPDAEGSALQLRAFHDASFGVGGAAIMEGQITRRLGFGWFMDQNVGSHTAGSLTGTIVVGAGASIGATTVQLDTGSGEAVALLVGDIVTFAGHTQTYVVTADLTVGASASGTLSFAPGLQVALTTEAITVKASHVLNLSFHRDAIAFATRPLEDSGDGLGSLIQSAIDEVSGLVLRLEVGREHKRTRWSFDILYGGEVVRRELGSRLAG